MRRPAHVAEWVRACVAGTGAVAVVSPVQCTGSGEAAVSFQARAARLAVVAVPVSGPVGRGVAVAVLVSTGSVGGGFQWRGHGWLRGGPLDGRQHPDRKLGVAAVVAAPDEKGG